jgi:hypothetical protein
MSSYADMLSLTSSLNANFYSQMNHYNAMNNRLKEMVQSHGKSSQAARGYGSPPLREYPITATDFMPVSQRMAPDLVANLQTGLTREQREGLKAVGNHYLTEFEANARKNNVANAMTFLLDASLLVATGKELSGAEENQATTAFNNTLAANADFITMSPRDKQLMYEQAVVVGGLIVFIDQQGTEQQDLAMRSEAKEISRTVIKQLLGFDVR